jgi:hypothetical protein
MVFILTVILVDATLVLLSFTYLLVIKEEDHNSMDFKGTEIVSELYFTKKSCWFTSSLAWFHWLWKSFLGVM